MTNYFTFVTSTVYVHFANTDPFITRCVHLRQLKNNPPCFLLDACWGAYIKFYLSFLKHCDMTQRCPASCYL